MSNQYNDAILENLFDEGMELFDGDAKKAEKYARKKFEELPEPDYKAEGGEAVPAKFKGFSKLPESVQQKMDPSLAQKYEAGGAVGSCRGMGAALRGGRFSGVK